GNDAGNNALPGDASARAGQTSISFAVHDHRDYGTKDSGGEQSNVALGLEGIAQDHTDDESNPDGDGEGYGQPGHINSGHQQQIGEIEYRTANHGGNNIGRVCGVDIIEKTVGIVHGATQGQRKHQGNEKNPDCIVPVEELEAVILDTLVSVGPRAPADGTRDHHQQCNAETVWCEHRFLLKPFLGDFAGKRCGSLAANFGDKKLQEPIRIYIDTDFRVGRDFIHALDHIVIPVENIALHKSVAIADGFPARELSPGFNVHAHLLHFHQRRINGNCDRGRIVHRRSRRPELCRKAVHELGNVVDEVAHWAVSLAQLVQVFLRQQSLVADLEAGHGDRPSCLKNYLGSLRIVVDVCFRRSVDIAAADRASHQDNLFHQRNDRRVLFDSE